MCAATSMTVHEPTTIFIRTRNTLYTKHRSVLGVTSSIANDSRDPATDYLSDLALSESSNIEECSEDPVDSYEGRMRASALIVLRTKHVHKVAQSSLHEIMHDISTKLETTVQHIQRDVMAELEDVGGVDESRKARLNEIFHTQEVTDPFCGLESQHRQKTVFMEQFNLLVCCMHCIIMMSYHLRLFLIHLPLRLLFTYYLSGYYPPVSDFFITTIQIRVIVHTSSLVCNLYQEGLPPPCMNPLINGGEQKDSSARIILSTRIRCIFRSLRRENLAKGVPRKVDRFSSQYGTTFMWFHY